MNDKTITAFSREYAEFTDMSPVDKKNISAICECFLKYTLRRYCLVEKGAVLKQFESAKRLIDARDYNKKCIGVGSRGVLERLFPDLGKEVEE